MRWVAVRWCSVSNILKRASLAVLIIVVAGCSLANHEEGTLSGHVTIGPLQPVLREGETPPTPSPQVYAAWQIVIYGEDGRKEIARTDVDPTGDYRVTLSLGTYMVTAKPADGRSGPGGSLTYYAEINRDKVTRLDLDIDTGIR